MKKNPHTATAWIHRLRLIKMQAGVCDSLCQVRVPRRNINARKHATENFALATLFWSVAE